MNSVTKRTLILHKRRCYHHSCIRKHISNVFGGSSLLSPVLTSVPSYTSERPLTVGSFGLPARVRA